MAQNSRKNSSLRGNDFKELQFLEDQELLEEFKGGNDKAFEEIFDRYHKPIYNLCFRMVGNLEEASDLTQETFAKAYKALPSMEEVKIFSWLYKVATNLNLDHFRKTKFLLKRSDKDFDFSAIADLSRDSNPVDAAEQTETRMMVWKAMMKLPPRYRMILNMREMQTLSYAEIGSMMDISLPAVESLLHRARAKFRKIYLNLPQGGGRSGFCKDILPLLTPYFDGELDENKKTEVENHLKECSFCNGELDGISNSSNLFKFIPMMAAPPVLKSSLFSQLGLSALAGSAAASGAAASSAAAAAGAKAAGVGAASKLAVGGLAGQAIAGAGVAKIAASVAAVALVGAVTATVATHPSIVKKTEQALFGKPEKTVSTTGSGTKSSSGQKQPAVGSIKPLSELTVPFNKDKAKPEKTESETKAAVKNSKESKEHQNSSGRERVKSVKESRGSSQKSKPHNEGKPKPKPSSQAKPKPKIEQKPKPKPEQKPTPKPKTGNDKPSKPN